LNTTTILVAFNIHHALAKILLAFLCPNSNLVSSNVSPRAASRRKICIIPSNYIFSGGKADDSAAVASAFAECSSNAIISFREGVDVPACPSTNPVEQPIDLFFNRPAHTTLLRVGIKAWPIGPLVSSLFNRPQGENYACSVAK
jgi:hypothetical protein